MPPTEGTEMQSGRMKKRAILRATGAHAEPACLGNAHILVVGEVSKWQARGRILPHDPAMVFLEFHEVDLDALQLRAPATVLSPVLCTSFDCLDLALRLDELGFRGRYRAMSSALPDPWLIRSEIADICPELDFDIVDLAKTTGQRLN